MSNQQETSITLQFKKAIKESTGVRLSLLFGSFFILLIIASFLIQTINFMPVGNERDHLLWGSVVQNVLVFCLPAFVLARFCSRQPLGWLKLTTPLNYKAIVGVLIVYFLTMPAMDWLVEWNAGLSLPESMSGLEATLRGWENAGTEAAASLVDSSGVVSLIVGVLVVGVLTGFSEEIFFRGGVQGIFIRSGSGAAMAIWITAALFSALHFQFFGFVPRLLMGVFFGYLLVWTNDIKISAFAHILNNSMVMIMGAIFGKEVLTSGTLAIYPPIPYLPLISFIVSVAFFVFFRGYFFKKQSGYPWQQRQLPPPIES